jgi:hypothetical protein
VQADAPTVKHEAPTDICDTEDGISRLNLISKESYMSIMNDHVTPDNLQRLLTTSRCVRCTKLYKEDENGDGACTYHPGSCFSLYFDSIQGESIFNVVI